MSLLRTEREIQRLIGRIVALNKFISRCTDKCLSFFKMLNRSKTFEWTDKCEDAFNELKKYLVTPLVLAKPEEGYHLYLYIAVSHAAVRGVLFLEDRGEHKPIFYIRKTLEDGESRYLTTEKLALALMVFAQKLRP